MEVEWDGIIASSLAIELYPQNSKEYLVSRVYIVIQYAKFFGYYLIMYFEEKKELRKKSTFGVYWKRIIPNRVPAD